MSAVRDFYLLDSSNEALRISKLNRFLKSHDPSLNTSSSSSNTSHSLSGPFKFELMLYPLPIKVVTVGESFVPTRLGMSCSAEHLWMVTGASNLPSSGPLAHVSVVSLCQKGLDPTVLEDGAVPGGKKLLEKLQGSSTVAKQGDALVAAAEAVKMAMRNLLIKREYSTEKRELRKKSRNDRKLKQIL